MASKRYGDARNPENAPLKGSENLRWTDQIQAKLQPTLPQTDEATGEVYNPRRRWMEKRIQQRMDEKKKESAD